MPRAVFDRLTAEADPLVRAGEHAQDEPPVDGGRWPVTIVCRPRPEARRRLDDEMRALLQYAGSRHFRTGRADSVHLTVRALESYREGAHPDEAVVRDWRAAVARTAARQPSFTLDCTGLALSKGGVMAQLEARDEQPWTLMASLREELGEHAWYEDQWCPRDIWYATLMHFAGPLDDPRGLVEHVLGRRTWEAFPVVVDTLSLCRYRYTDLGGERLMLPELWATVQLGGHPSAPEVASGP